MCFRPEHGGSLHDLQLVSGPTPDHRHCLDGPRLLRFCCGSHPRSLDATARRAHPLSGRLPTPLVPPPVKIRFNTEASLYSPLLERALTSAPDALSEGGTVSAKVPVQAATKRGFERRGWVDRADLAE